MLKQITNSIILLLVPFQFVQSQQVLDEITVTASRTPSLKKEQGSSVTTIDQQQIENRQAPFLPNLLRTVPGVSVNQAGGDGSLTQLRIRGGEANHTLVLIDGIEANDIARGAEFDFAHFSTCGLDSIEVLRGPQSSLWGSDALSGVVNLQSQKGQGPLQFETTLQAGRYNSYYNCSGLLAGNDQQNFSLFGSYFDSNGFNISELGGDDDGYRNRTASFNYGAKLADQLEITVTGRHVRFKNESDQIPGTQLQDDRYTQANQNYLRLHLDFNNENNTFENAFDISFANTENEFYVDGDRDTKTTGDKLKFSYQSSVSLPVNKNRRYGHKFTLAAEREFERFEQKGVVSFFGDPNQMQKITNDALIGEYNFKIPDQFYFSASLRRDFNEEFDNSSSKRFSVSYSPNQFATRFHAGYGTAVKNPTFVERFGFTPDTFIGNPQLSPEKSAGWEVGITQIFSIPLQLGLTYFSEKLEDEIDGFFFEPSLNNLAGGFTSVNQPGTSCRDGIEVSFSTEFAWNWQLNGAYTFLNAREPNDQGSRREIRRPRYMASAEIAHQFNAGKGNISLYLDHSGSQLDRDFSSFPTATVKLSAYTLVNLAMHYQINRWLTIEGLVENLFDEEYQNTFGFETAGVNAHVGLKLGW